MIWRKAASRARLQKQLLAESKVAKVLQQAQDLKPEDRQKLANIERGHATSMAFLGAAFFITVAALLTAAIIAGTLSGSP